MAHEKVSDLSHMTCPFEKPSNNWSYEFLLSWQLLSIRFALDKNTILFRLSMLESLQVPEPYES